ncbi:MAG: transposase [Isosphaeraceae bacterium]
MLKLDYRGLRGLLADAPALREAIGPRVAPHHTTFQKAAARMLGDADVAKLLDATTAGGPPSTPEVAVDSTGLTTSHASEYFTRRRRETGAAGARTAYHAYSKLSLACDVVTHEVLALCVGTGPGPDVTEFVGLVDAARGRRKFERVLADAGHDSESNHRHARESLGVGTLVPATKGRPPKDGKPPTGRYRREMAESFDREAYGQRWQVETVMSMVKRRMGWTTWSRSDPGRGRDPRLLALTHNVLI